MSSSNSQPDVQSLQARIAELEKRLDARQKIIDDQKGIINDRESLIYNKEVQLQKLINQLSQLQTMHFGASSERHVPTLDPRQMKLDFFNEAELLAALEEALERKKTSVKAHKRKGRKSKPLPDHLPVVEVEHEPDHSHCQDCGTQMKRIGEQSIDQLGIVPLVFFIIRHIRPKMACPRKCGVHTATMPQQPLPGTQASPVLLAYLMVAKYLDGCVPRVRGSKGLGIVRNFTIDEGLAPRSRFAGTGFKPLQAA